MRTPRVLSIAGSDSGGGAGIQADLKAFAACRVHGMTAITAITAQNTVGVTAVHAVPADVIVAQVQAVQEDIGVDAVKIGMLGDLPTIEAVSRALDLLEPGTPVVLDPVLVAESGAELLAPSARRGLLELLMPRVTVTTPNLLEAQALVAAAGEDAALAPPENTASDPDVAHLVRAIHALGPHAVVLTGGHRQPVVDLFFNGRQLVEIPGPRHPDGAAHGSGCTHSSVLAARLAWGDDPLTAARTARRMAAQAVGDGLRDVGHGPGPVDVLGLAARGEGSGSASAPSAEASTAAPAL
jgi:hydroxymethylpyrimidine/phosphomethylpyrimidine kinase